MADENTLKAKVLENLLEYYAVLRDREQGMPDFGDDAWEVFVGKKSDLENGGVEVNFNDKDEYVIYVKPNVSSEEISPEDQAKYLTSLFYFVRSESLEKAKAQKALGEKGVTFPDNKKILEEQMNAPVGISAKDYNELEEKLETHHQKAMASVRKLNTKLQSKKSIGI